ncbi:MAG: N-acetyl-gamma-glutamyl-phosphate reductase [Leptonema sp. (in: Bacteria)]|nr:N-acetyl-gamma-glutamyl-phosphate reductase [Leptonema sp. (in: bacteria)]
MVDSKIDIAVLGAGGLTGRELLRLFRHHPSFRPAHITSDHYASQTVAEVFSELDGADYSNLTFSKHSDTIPEGLPVFMATPNKESAEIAPKLRQQGRAVVDLSGSFRISNPQVFESVYGFSHPNFDWVQKSVFGFPEMFRDEIKSAHLKGKILANPGCYPTSVIGALAPLQSYLPKANSIIVDSKSGVSGAGGRVEDAGFSFGGVYENFRAYKVLKHQHEPEIVEQIGRWANFTPDLLFTPHLLPMFRGIFSTIVIIWKEPIDTEQLFNSAKQFCESEPFLRLRSSPEEVQLKNVQYTNYIDIGMRSRENKTVIVSAIDNLVKGAAGQAIQNMNLMLGLKETAGLLE